MMTTKTRRRLVATAAMALVADATARGGSDGDGDEQAGQQRAQAPRVRASW